MKYLKVNKKERKEFKSTGYGNSFHDNVMTISADCQCDECGKMSDFCMHFNLFDEHGNLGGNVICENCIKESLITIDNFKKFITEKT
jgi:hypothetical protein